jgi:hypothetical protein
VRRVVDKLAAVIQAVCLLAEAEWELLQGVAGDKPDALAFLINRTLRAGYDPMDDPIYGERVARLATGL